MRESSSLLPSYLQFWPTIRCTRLSSTLLSRPNRLFPNWSGRLARAMASRSFCLASRSRCRASAACFRFSAISISLLNAESFGLRSLLFPSVSRGRRSGRGACLGSGSGSGSGSFIIATRSGCSSSEAGSGMSSDFSSSSAVVKMGLGVLVASSWALILA